MSVSGHDSESSFSGKKPVNVSAYQVGQIVHAVSAKFDTRRTEPPPRYSQDTLLDDMLTAHKFAKDDGDRDILKKVEGLGTSRTRQPMIDGAIKRGFFSSTKKGKRHILESTPMAKTTIAALQPELKDVALTAKYEHAFSLIELGIVTYALVVDKAYDFIVGMITYAKNQKGTVRIAVAAPVANAGSKSKSFASSGAGRR